MLKSDFGRQKSRLKTFSANLRSFYFRDPFIPSKLVDKNYPLFHLRFHLFRIRYLLPSVQNTLNRILIFTHTPLSLAKVANTELSTGKAVFA
jgi:hypothetical protein